MAHTLGMPFDLDKILELAEKYRLWVIEDNCDALGAEYTMKREYNLIRNKKVSGRGKTGTFGHIGTSSFYPAHQITMGEGGAVYTSDIDLYRIAKSFRGAVTAGVNQDATIPVENDSSSSLANYLMDMIINIPIHILVTILR